MLDINKNANNDPKIQNDVESMKFVSEMRDKYRHLYDRHYHRQRKREDIESCCKLNGRQ